MVLSVVVINSDRGCGFINLVRIWALTKNAMNKINRKEEWEVWGYIKDELQV
jgi:hypothetical protein